jgi:hypothetical protein
MGKAYIYRCMICDNKMIGYGDGLSCNKCNSPVVPIREATTIEVTEVRTKPVPPKTRTIADNDRRFCHICGSGMVKAKWWHIKPTVCRKRCANTWEAEHEIIQKEFYEKCKGTFQKVWKRNTREMKASNIMITLDEYRKLILDNQRLTNEVEFLKNRIDRGMAIITNDMRCIKEKIGRDIDTFITKQGQGE